MSSLRWKFIVTMQRVEKSSENKWMLMIAFCVCVCVDIKLELKTIVGFLDSIWEFSNGRSRASQFICMFFSSFLIQPSNIETIFPKPKNSHLLIAIHFYPPHNNGNNKRMTDESTQHTIKYTNGEHGDFSDEYMTVQNFPFNPVQMKYWKVRIWAAANRLVCVCVCWLSAAAQNEISIWYRHWKGDTHNGFQVSALSMAESMFSALYCFCISSAPFHYYCIFITVIHKQLRKNRNNTEILD